MTTPTDGPFVQAFLICEGVDFSSPGKRATVVNVTAGAALLGSTPELVPGTPAGFTFYVSLTGGNQDAWAVMIRARNPAGEEVVVLEAMLDRAPGEDGGGLIVKPLVIGLTQVGLYWFDLLIDGVLMSRAPLKIVYAQRPASDRVPLN